jgi:hypothetical protein
VSRTLPLALLLIVPVAAADPKAAIEKDRVVVTGVSSAKGLSLVVAEGTEAEIAARPPVSGEWAAADGKAVFTPKYPLKPGTKYRVLGTAVALDVRTAAPEPGKPTVLTHVYPTGSDLPENVFRFYLHFSRPMPRGDVYRYVRVLDDAGKPVVQPFLELDDELWNPDQTRLTLLIDPGRLKREVKPQIDLGPVFRAGKKYTLVISGKWPDLDGRPLGDDVTRPLTIGPREADALDPKAWKFTPPAGERSSLALAFPRVMDHALLMRSLTVIGPDGREVPGSVEVTNAEKAWSFRPKAAWAAGEYKLRVDPVLEDVCGNRVGRPFEVDVSGKLPPEVKAEAVDLPFRVAAR